MKTKNPWTKLKTQAGNIGVVRRCLVLAGVATALLLPQARAQPTNPAEFRAQFVELCDLAANKLLEANGITEANGRPHYFVDSYAIRALCVAYDLTGKPEYLNTCRAWSERVLNYQQQMTPAGAYYMHYGRKPGETNGDWYVADSSSIAMAVLATAVRCQGAEQKRRVHSAEQFADLVTIIYQVMHMTPPTITACDVGVNRMGLAKPEDPSRGTTPAPDVAKSAARSASVAFTPACAACEDATCYCRHAIL